MQQNPSAGASAGETRLVISKAELLASIQTVRAILLEYGVMIENIAETDEWSRQALEVVRNHQTQCGNGVSPLSKMDLITGVFQYLVGRINQEEFNFTVPARANLIQEEENPALAEFSTHLRFLKDPTEKMISQVLALANAAEVRAQPKVHSLLIAVASFFKAIIRQDWEDVGLVITHINLITTSPESHDLVGQIATMARNIYNSLHEFSEFFTVESLSQSTGELPDAVKKLRSVIEKLEDAANTNLDSLEKLNMEVGQNVAWAETSLATLGQCDQKLEALQKQHPELTAAVGKIRESLAGGVTGKVENLKHLSQQASQTYLDLIANQSFQDLTGQTLKKVISFIETLQFKLVDLLPDPSGKKQEPEGEIPEEKKAYQSQEKVDQLLADLGF